MAVLGGVTGCTGSPSPPAAGTTTLPGFSNPVYAADFPDPMVLPVAGGYLAVGTNGPGGNVQTLTSPDLVSWTPGLDALPRLPGWSEPGDVWAPEIAVGPTQDFRLYYTTHDRLSDRQCVGVGTARVAAGPYVDRRPGPLVCQHRLGGSIDPHPFTAADGRRFLYWKNDGNAVGVDTDLWVQPLAPDGLSLRGRPRRILTADQDWEGALVEAPYVVEHDGRFHLFYSANGYATSEYAVGHAVADSPLGPFVKTPDPVLTGNAAAGGPGHCALVERSGRWWMIFHAWPPERIGADLPGRQLWLSEVHFAAGGGVRVDPPRIHSPTRP